TSGREAGARGEESELRELPSGEPITCRILRLASTPMPPTTTATLSVHINCRQVQAVNVVMMCFNVSTELNGFVPYLRTR
ncbi:hypothetical protein Taro_048980, partial [Colocasia esculenta]|nr:hypothetical protein [Colocasia esculenta]